MRAAIRRQAGFTLIELIVVMVVAAIMVGLAVPSFKSFTANQRVKAAVSDFTASSLLARSEAIKRNAAITVAGNPTWAEGWTVKAGATTLAQSTVREATVAVTQITDGAAVTSFNFAPNGRLTAASKLRFKVSSGTTNKCVEVGTEGFLSQVACP